MQDLVKVEDPNDEGGITLMFADNRYIKIKVVDGKLESESSPE